MMVSRSVAEVSDSEERNVDIKLQMLQRLSQVRV